jgi:hypothetical protein
MYRRTTRSGRRGKKKIIDVKKWIREKGANEGNKIHKENRVRKRRKWKDEKKRKKVHEKNNEDRRESRER